MELPFDFDMLDPKVLAIQDPRDIVQSDNKIEIPLVSSEPDYSSDNNDFSPRKTLSNMAGDAPAGASSDKNIFEKSFALTIKNAHADVMHNIEQERLDPSDAIARLPVPHVDFSIPVQSWIEHLSTAQAHFRWLQEQDAKLFNLYPPKPNHRNDSNLKWAPMSCHEGKKSIREDALELTSSARTLLEVGSVPVRYSSPVYTSGNLLAILQTVEDEVLGDDWQPEDKPSDNPAAGVKTLQPTNISCVIPGPQSIQALKGDGNLPSLVSGSLPTPSSTYSGKRYREEGVGGGVSGRDFGLLHSTGSLLSSFMNLRSAKRARKNNINPCVAQKLCSPIDIIADQKQLAKIFGGVRNTEDRDLFAMQQALPLLRTEHTHCAVVSVSIDWKLLRLIGSIVEPSALVDRDYEKHSSSSSSTSEPGCLEFEADLSLSPGFGIVITNLLKIKQRPLPGSTILPPIRERITRVSSLYECLVVVVFDALEPTQATVDMSESDVAGYREFVLFTESLDAGVKTQLVLGGGVALSKCLRSLLSQSTEQIAGLGQYLAVTESTWEVFLRRLGLNVFAAQILAGALYEQNGNLGLVRFLSMSKEQMTANFSQLLGGSKLLLKAGKILNE